MSLLPRITRFRPRRPWLILFPQNLRQPEVMVLCSSIHSVPQSQPTVTRPTSNSSPIYEPPVVPVREGREGRTLILCFDGTGAQFDEDNSNVVRFFQMLHKGDPLRQKVYYQAGFGTGITTSGSANKYINEFYGLVDAAFANGLPVHVQGGYEFLMNNYKKGDKISLFGFSRGAYTARALAGMLDKVGLLPSHNYEQIRFAYRHYKKDDAKWKKQSEAFKKAFSVKVKVDFVGVFDTVGSVGLIHRELPFVMSPSLVGIFRHALALDERRANFDANLWGRSTHSKGKRYRLIDMMKDFVWGDNNADHGQAKENDSANKDDQWYGHDSGRPNVNTDTKEVWFAGAHGDVGGGAVKNETVHDLARIPLRWMVLECFRNNTGILFKSIELDKIGLNPATLNNFPAVPGPKLTGLNKDGSPRYEGEHENKAAVVLSGITADKTDAVQPIHDRLDMTWKYRNIWWWILELLPIKHWYQSSDGTWKARWRWMNLGSPRTLYLQEENRPHVHWSVKYRMQHGKGYKPHVELKNKPGPQWVD